MFFFKHKSTYKRIFNQIESMSFIIAEQAELIREQRNIIQDLKEQVFQLTDK